MPEQPQRTKNSTRAHVELIQATEKLSLELGGTGYLSPGTSATPSRLLADAREHAGTELNTTVWKVARRSVGWDRGPYLKTRLLRGYGRYPGVRVTLLGGNRDWYFVAVCASDAINQLDPRSERV